METLLHHLVVAENFFGKEFKSPEDAATACAALSREQVKRLYEEYVKYETAWEPLVANDTSAMHIGRCYDTFADPSNWEPSHFGPFFWHDLDRLIRLLIYIPRISIWSPTMISDEEMSSADFASILGALVTMRPFLDDGSFQVVPDRYYRKVCGRQVDPKKTKMIRLAIRESRNPTYKKVLDQLQFYDEDEIRDGYYHYFWSMADLFKYVNPLNELNEDIAVQSVIGGNTLCANPLMHDLLIAKYQHEATLTNEMTWANISLRLPGLKKVQLTDLVSVRRNEDAFETWRTCLSAAIRESETLVKTGYDTSEVISDIFKERLLPVSLLIKEKVKSHGIRKLAEPGIVSFVSGAIAAMAISSSPAATVRTAAITSTLRIIYDVFKARKLVVNRSLLRMYALVGEGKSGSH